MPLCALGVCRACMPPMCALYVRLVHVPYVYALNVFRTCIPHLRCQQLRHVLMCTHVLMCMPCMCALYVFLQCVPYIRLTNAVRRRAMPDPHKNPTQLGPAWRLVGAASAGPAALKATARDEYHRRSGMCTCRA